MKEIIKARIKLNNHFPINLKYFYYKGVKISREAFYNVK